MIDQEMIDRARESAMAFYDNCKRPDLSERDKVQGALLRYQMSLDASFALQNVKWSEVDGS
ncbi:hypothetical protein AU106_gp164 [Sinorhizobium phage phiM9]|uniref:Uncharacterized protein n=1 Tax=Sinorhizobium phage phiM9 TaxID=1636182 RepID=A0A0F6R600_9CAUD|nr:hypothetical protein AU106_gp164 [Sinorhizobium phage phiM9]AKE44795.1 hypothetical protein Sm_phiM9_167 [Sinorhizobium phage phiM9]